MLPKKLEFFNVAKMTDVEHMVHSTSLVDSKGAGSAFESGHFP
jgi:hypothetical protein